MILTPSYDPFPTRDAETRRDTVLVVDVADVGFEASCGLVVPKTNRAVVGCGEDVFGVGRELDLLASR